MGMMLHGRGEIGGMLRLLLAALLLLSQAVAQAATGPVANSSADAVERLALQTLCHGAPSDDRTPAPVPVHHDCLFCPACHLAAHAVVLGAGSPAVLPPVLAFIGLAAPPPTSTGPPPRYRVSAPSTGPPAISA
jgi:hypothetical protein